MDVTNEDTAWAMIWHEEKDFRTTVEMESSTMPQRTMKDVDPDPDALHEMSNDPEDSIKNLVYGQWKRECQSAMKKEWTTNNSVPDAEQEAAALEMNNDYWRYFVRSYIQWVSDDESESDTDNEAPVESEPDEQLEFAFGSEAAQFGRDEDIQRAGIDYEQEQAAKGLEKEYGYEDMVATFSKKKISRNKNVESCSTLSK